MAKNMTIKKASQRNWAEERSWSMARDKEDFDDGLMERRSSLGYTVADPTSGTQHDGKRGQHESPAGRTVRAAESSNRMSKHNAGTTATRGIQSTRSASEAGVSTCLSGGSGKSHTSFSAMTWDNLERFHLSKYAIGPISERAFRYIRSQVRRESDEAYVKSILGPVELAKMWEKQTVALGVSGRLKGLYTSVSRKSEDWARLVINVMLDVVREHTETLGRRSIQLHSEMTLATGVVSLNELQEIDEYWAVHKKTCCAMADQLEEVEELIKARANPGKIEKGSELEYATGTVDFMVVNTPRKINRTDAHFFEGLKKGYTLDRSIAILGPCAQLSTFLPIEAKAFSETLIKHLPQMLAQSLISMAKLRCERMPWVLSNGDEWLFGITSTRGGRWKYVYLCQADSMMGGSEYAKRDGTPDMAKTLAQAELNMKWLVLWSYADPDVLWDAVEHYRVHGRDNKCRI